MVEALAYKGNLNSGYPIVSFWRQFCECTTRPTV